MKVLIFGCGWLGGKFAEHFNGSLSAVDILDVDEVMRELVEMRPDVVVNAAGKTGRPNIDWCIATPANQRLTRYVNDCGVAVLRAAVERMPIRHRPKLVHLSSGCLWEHAEGCTEDTVPEPPSWYSTTKVCGEERLRGSNAIIVRLRMPFDGSGHERCLLTKLLKYDKVISYPNSLTYVPDLLIAVERLLNIDEVGTWNVVNSGHVLNADIMEMLRCHVRPSMKYEVVTQERLLEQGIIKERRSNCTLSTDRLERWAAVVLPHVTMRLEQCMSRLAAEIPKTT